MRVRFNTLSLTYFALGLFIGVLSLFLVFFFGDSSTLNKQRVEQCSALAFNIIASGPLPLDDVLVRDAKGQHLLLSSSLEEGKLVLYLPSISCIPCAQKGISTLDSVFKDHFRDRIVLVSSFENLHTQKIIENEFNVNTYSILTDTLLPSDSFAEKPMAFYCDSTMVIGNYYSDDFTDGLFDGWAFYFQAIYHRFEEETLDGSSIY